ERVARCGQDLETLPREPVITLDGLIGIGGRADRDAFTAPRTARQLLAQHLGHVRLHAHGLAVLLARRPVGPALVAADIAVGAAVRAAHVGVQRPLEGHPLHRVQRAPAGLLAIHRANHGRPRLSCLAIPLIRRLVMGLEGKVAMITGIGGEHGFGRAIARRLATEGCDLVLTDVASTGTKVVAAKPSGNWGGLDAVADEVKKAGRRAITGLVDVRSTAQIDAAVREALDTFGRLDILVNNAAAPPGADRVPVIELSEEAWSTVRDVNLKGTFLGSRAVARAMLERNVRGRIVHISSNGGKMGYPKLAAYRASRLWRYASGSLEVARRRARASGETGFTRWASNPASLERRRSSVWPYPVTAMSVAVLPNAEPRSVRATS